MLGFWVIGGGYYLLSVAGGLSDLGSWSVGVRFCSRGASHTRLPSLMESGFAGVAGGVAVACCHFPVVDV